MTTRPGGHQREIGAKGIDQGELCPGQREVGLDRDCLAKMVQALGDRVLVPAMNRDRADAWRKCDHASEIFGA